MEPATANASTMASQLAVVSRLWPAPAISSAALLAAVSGSLTALPTSGMWSALWPADFRLSATPSAPPWTCRPTSAIVDTAVWTAKPTSTQTKLQMTTTVSLNN